MTRLRNRVWVRFNGWQVTVHPALGRERSFDARRVAAIHWRGVGNTAHRTYQIKMRAPDGERPLRLGVPVTLLRDSTRAQDELLSRVAAAPSPKADKHTGATLEGLAPLRRQPLAPDSRRAARRQLSRPEAAAARDMTSVWRREARGATSTRPRMY